MHALRAIKYGTGHDGLVDVDSYTQRGLVVSRSLGSLESEQENLCRNALVRVIRREACV